MTATCECAKNASHHEAGECQGTAHVRVRRDGVDINVCPNCTLSSDKRHIPRGGL